MKESKTHGARLMTLVAAMTLVLGSVHAQAATGGEHPGTPGPRCVTRARLCRSRPKRRRMSSRRRRPS